MGKPGETNSPYLLHISTRRIIQTFEVSVLLHLKSMDRDDKPTTTFQEIDIGAMNSGKPLRIRLSFPS